MAKKTKKVYPFVQRFIFPIFRLFIKKVRGIGNIPKKGAFIIVANHSSYLDPLIVSAVFVSKTNRGIRFITKVGVLWRLLPEWVSVKWAGCIPIKKTRLFREKPLPASIKLLHKGEIIGIFPEGGRNFGKLMKSHTGVARMAVEGFPVVPVGIIGTQDIYPRGRFLPKLKRAVILNIGKPMLFKKIDENRINKKILKKVTRKIMKRVGELAGLEYGY